MQGRYTFMAAGGRCCGGSTVPSMVEHWEAFARRGRAHKSFRSRDRYSRRSRPQRRLFSLSSKWFLGWHIGPVASSNLITMPGWPVSAGKLRCGSFDFGS